MTEHPLLARLRELLGAAHVLTEGDLSAWEVDWRKRYRGRALAVVRPGTTSEVAAVVRACAEAGVSVVPQGGNTGLVGGGVPDSTGRQILLSLSRMREIRAIDQDNLTLTVEAGCILETVQAAAAEVGLLFPLSLAAEGSCTIGGNLATNAGGTQVLQFGNARDLCLGLEVVTAKGEVWHGLSGLRKDNTGYDLRHLFIGSEGTLGIITAATLKLFPQPGASVTALAACSDVNQTVRLLNLARRHLGATLTGLELMSGLCLELVARHFPQLSQPFPAAPWTVLLELSASSAESGQQALETVMEMALEEGAVEDVIVAANLHQAKQLWHLRESIPLAQAEEGLNIKHDIALPISAIPQFVETTGAKLKSELPGVRMVTFGHLGDGNLHYNLQAPVGVSASEFLLKHETTANAIVYDAVQTAGGSISAEHGIGALKRDELAQRKSAVALNLMRQIKLALDPNGVLNPNRVLSDH